MKLFPASMYIETFSVLKILNQISGTLICMVLLFTCISLVWVGTWTTFDGFDYKIYFSSSDASMLCSLEN